MGPTATFLTSVPLDLAQEVASSLTRSGNSGAPPITFGREAIFVGSDPAPAERHSFQRRSFPAGRRLAAVVQKGRLFQQTYPDELVLFDRGRFLLVAVDPASPALTERRTEPCFGIFPVEPGETVFEEFALGPLRASRDPAVEAALNRLSVSTFQAVLEGLVALHTRLSTSEFYREGADMCRARLADLGYIVSLQDFEVGQGSSCNVLAVPAGSAPPAALVVAHLDSINHADGDQAAAPGADDNASGSAGVIAMAEALMPLQERLPVGCVLFGGEEQGLWGSRHFLESLSSEARASLKAVINMDMIGSLNRAPGSPDGAAGVLLEGAAVSRAVIDELAVQAATWTDLKVQVSLNPFASDHVPFIEAQLPAVLTIEGADQTNTTIHGPNDTLDRINAEYAQSILRMNTAYLASLALR